MTRESLQERLSSRHEGPPPCFLLVDRRLLPYTDGNSMPQPIRCECHDREAQKLTAQERLVPGGDT